jgi:simple sugar transport system ATP-binding protein
MLEVANISKYYGPVAANRDISFGVAPGEMVGLLGENGAGKSTILSILSGRLRPDSGDLRLGGRPLDLTSPEVAIRQGISAVYQHFSQIETFTVREQLRLIGWQSDELPAMLHGQFSGNERIGGLSPGERQTIEIAKSLISKPKVLLLDEPTSILTSAEIDRLFGLLRQLRDEGMAIVFVTHKLKEALEVSNRILVLRRGELGASIDRTEGTWPIDIEKTLLRAMFAGNVAKQVVETGQVKKRSGSDAKELFSARHFSPETGQTQTLVLHEREILAIVGVDGQGQRELAEFCAGYRTGGEVRLRGTKLIPGHPDRFREAGITWLTGDRIGEGSVPELSVASNLILKRQRERPFSRRGWLDRAAISDFADRQIREWNINTRSPQSPIRELSGGNIQKVLLARELPMASSVLIATNPTQGLDVLSQHSVWSALRRLANSESGVAIFTTELDEAIENADRVAVMFNGRLSDSTPVFPGVRPQLERMMTSGW